MGYRSELKFLGDGKFLSDRNTTIYIITIWTLSIIMPSYFHARGDCALYYTDAIYAFVWTSNEYCTKVSWYMDFAQDVSIVILIAIIDTITIIKYRITSVEMAKSTCKKTALKRNADKNLLIQTVAQGIVFAMELSTYFVLSGFFENKWVVWMLTTFAWTTVHSSDAFIIIIFNTEFRRLICSPKKLFTKKSRITHEGLHNTVHSGGLNTQEGSGF
ncbi:hypothetical protein GCK32_008497 [Trichostrongylus colubriformis]|uniref:7TM GPCR serpentine receptor class x (Srx) domain-containing protein n=1 Tax=Trichostrongylus colubriformis TaxID=6319 RepID=A0AAN8FEI6_TRICO